VQRSSPPEGALKVLITARPGAWTATYSAMEKVCDNRLVAAVSQPVAVTVESPHGTLRLCLPEFGLDETLKKGEIVSFWLQPDETSRLEVGRGCGDDIATMAGVWMTVSASDFAAWSRSGDCAPLDPAAPGYGEKLFSRLGCSSCHNVDGRRGAGPPLDGLFGRRETLVDGTEVVVDEAYVRESILRPQAKVVRGFAPTMPELGDRQDPQQLDALLSYLRSLVPIPKPLPSHRR
jgi:cytochrome c oxidase subunit 2